MELPPPCAPFRSQPDRPAAPIIGVALAAIGTALIAAVIAANQTWLDQHFLPSFFVPRRWYVWIETSVRMLLGAMGLLLVLGRSRLTRLLIRSPWAALQVTLAAVLAIAASEFALRWSGLRPTEWLRPAEEPRRQDDPRLGWVLTPARAGHSVVGGRPIEYAIDAAGYRVRSVTEPVNPGQPTLVFAGESVMFGEGLAWAESIPAQTGAILGIQSANLAVHGYSTDQIYLRLARELPRFRQPVAAVSIFMIELFGRNLDDDRPHLAPGLAWLPAQHASRLMSLAGLLVPYRRVTTIEQGLRTTREALRAMVQLSRDRGAQPLVVVPRFGAEDAVQRDLRERIFTGDVPTLVVPLDPDWRLPWDRHPNARAAHIIAVAIAARLHT